MIRAKRLLGFTLETSAARRRFVLLYWAAVAVMHVLLCQMLALGSGIGFGVTVACLLVLPLLLGGFSVGGVVESFADSKLDPAVLADVASRAGIAPGDPRLKVFRDLDERQAQIRDRAHYLSYTVIAWAVAVFAALLGVLSLLNLGGMAAAGKIGMILLLVGTWSLPQTFILWREPNDAMKDGRAAR